MRDRHLWRFMDSGPGSGSRNMQVDEELLNLAQSGPTAPVLRFYTWDPPAVSLGRFQSADDAVDEPACRRRGIDIVRRVTGGRAVLHARELTYSIIARIDCPLFPATVLGTYQVIAHALVNGLDILGVPAELVARGQVNASLVQKAQKNPACFSSPSWYEIVVNGRKLVGSAQRRLSRAFLQHGSILIDYDTALEAEVIPGSAAHGHIATLRQCLSRDVSPEEIIRALKQGFAETLGVSFISGEK